MATHETLELVSVYVGVAVSEISGWSAHTAAPVNPTAEMNADPSFGPPSPP